jgi:MoaA/NifB/PqqE/SkfB family radical SAM enzyme
MKGLKARVNQEGRLILPPDVASHYGMMPGADVDLEEMGDGLHLRRPVTHLAKAYIEPTSGCNLACRTCIRKSWEEPLGQMRGTTFSLIIKGLSTFLPAPNVSFGGFGEPLSHPDIVERVVQAKAIGSSVELITNGTLLTWDMSNQLIKAGLDALWVSLDGATPASYADIRVGAALPDVLSNLKDFRLACRTSSYSPTKLGIVFVAMKRNIADLPSVLQLGNRLGATRFVVSNILPYTADMCEEVLYSRSIGDNFYMRGGSKLQITKMDLNPLTRESLYEVVRGTKSLGFTWERASDARGRCPFIEQGAVAFSWEGNVSPCLPLLHSHTSFLDHRERLSRCYVIGSIAEHMT